MNGGIIKSRNVAVYAVISVGTLVVPKDSTVSVYAPRGVAVDAGTATIAGGSFTTFNARFSGENGGYVAAEVYYPLYVYKAGVTVEVTGGTFTVENEDVTQAVAAVQVGSASGETVSSSVTIKGGTFNAPIVSRGATPVQGISVEDGKFAYDPACVHDADGLHYSFAAEGKIGVKGNDGYYTLTNGAYVAKTEKQCFATVADAVAAAEAGETIKLLDNVHLTASVTIAAGKDVTLDLNGKAITVAENPNDSTKHLYAFANYGAFTLMDSVGTGSVTARGAVDNYGTFTMNSGAVYNADINGGYGVWVNSGGTFIMNGGTIENRYVGNYADSNNPYNPSCLNLDSGATAKLFGGTLKSASVRTYAIISAGTLEIPEGSTVSVTGARGVAINAGSAVINGGTLTCFDGRFTGDPDNGDNGFVAAEIYYTLYVSGGAVTINGGTFNAAVPDTAYAYASPTYCMNMAGNITINGGIFNGEIGSNEKVYTGTIAITGGKFLNWDPACNDAKGDAHNHSFVTEGKIGVQGDDGYYTLANGAYVANGGEQCYATLQSAINTVITAGGGTAKLLADTTEEVIIANTAATKARIMTFSTTTEMTLDLNGYSVAKVSVPATTSLTIEDTSSERDGSIGGLVMESGAAVTKTDGVTVDNVTLPEGYTWNGNVLEEPTYAVTVNGTTTEVKQGVTYTITAEAKDGFTFVGWSGDLTSTAATLSIVVTKDLTITSNYLPTTLYTEVESKIEENYTAENELVSLKSIRELSLQYPTIKVDSTTAGDGTVSKTVTVGIKLMRADSLEKNDNGEISWIEVTADEMTAVLDEEENSMKITLPAEADMQFFRFIPKEGILED